MSRRPRTNMVVTGMWLVLWVFGGGALKDYLDWGFPLEIAVDAVFVVGLGVALNLEDLRQSWRVDRQNRKL